MNVKRFISIALAVVVLSFVAPVYANAQPPVLPHTFYGTLKFDVGGTIADAPAGTVVEARGKLPETEVMTGTPDNPIVTTEVGKYGSENPLGQKLAVQGTIADGAIITFWVQRPTDAAPHQADQTAEWHSMAIEELPLTVTVTTPPPPPAGGGGAPPTYYTGTNLFGIEGSFRISLTGEILETITGTSADGNLTVTIPAGTIALDKDGNRLSSLTVAVDPSPPPPPEGAHIIGLAYTFLPAGATFDPPITLEYTYDPAEIPEGVAEEDLVLAYYDEATGAWVELPCTVDPVTHRIIATVSHFTTFAIIAHIPPPAPAAFSLSNLTVQPAEVQPKEAVTIAVSVANTGGTEGSYTVVLKINGVKEAEKSVTVAAGGSQDVNFSVTKEDAASYSVTVDGLSGSFTVVSPLVVEPAAFSVSNLSIQPAEVPTGEAVTIAVSVANTGGTEGSYAVVLNINGVKEAETSVTIAAGGSETVTFSVTKEDAARYSVTVDGLSGSFTVVAPAVVTNWPLLGGIIGGVIVVALLVFFLMFRRRAY